MRLPDLCIRRPVFATVLSLVVVLIGLVSFSRLTVREYPNIDPPVVLVQTVYRGASAEVIESTVTRVLEESIAGIEGIDYLRSTTRQENSQVVVRFKLGRDVEAPPTTCGIGSGGSGDVFPMRSTSQLSPRSRPTHSRCSISRFHRIATRHSTSLISPIVS